MRVELIQTVLKTVMLTDTSILFHLLFSICNYFQTLPYHNITFNTLYILYLFDQPQNTIKFTNLNIIYYIFTVNL